jgi:hypothetical protein
VGYVPLLGFMAAPLIGVALALSLVATVAGVIGIIRLKGSDERFFWFLLVLCLIEVLALTHWLLLFLGMGSPLSGLALFELDLYYLLAVFTPIPLIILLFGWVPKLFSKRSRGEGYVAVLERGWTSWNLGLFIFSIGLVLFALYYPLSGGVNPHNLLLGYDFYRYKDSSQPILSDPLKAFSTFDGERPIVFLLIFAVHAVSSIDIFDLLLILPFIFLSLLVAASGFLGWEMFRRADVASWCSFFTACGVFVVETIYGYFLGNIIGLFLIILSLALLFRFIRVGSWALLGLSLISGVLAYFSHPLTLELYAGGLAAVWVIQLLRRNVPTRLMRVIPYFLVIVVCFGLLSWFFVGNRALLDPYDILSSSNGVLFSLDFLVGGYTSNLILLGLAALGLLLIEYDSLSSSYLGVLFAVSGACFLFLNNVYRFRLFIALPLGLVAAIGFVEILGRIRTVRLRYAVTSFVLLFFTVYLLRSMANLI